MANDDLDPRVRALEERMAGQEGLRASQDRDLSDLQQDTKSTKKSVQALALTQSEHTTRLDRIERTVKSNSEVLGALVVESAQRFAAVDARLDRMDARFDGVDARFDGVDARFDQHMGLLSEILAKVDRLGPATA